MPDETQIEKRLDSLERAVAALNQRLAPEDWIGGIAASITDDQAFDQALSHGRKLRQKSDSNSADTM